MRLQDTVTLLDLEGILAAQRVKPISHNSLDGLGAFSAFLAAYEPTASLLSWGLRERGSSQQDHQRSRIADSGTSQSNGKMSMNGIRMPCHSIAHENSFAHEKRDKDFPHAE